MENAEDEVVAFLEVTDEERDQEDQRPVQQQQKERSFLSIIYRKMFRLYLFVQAIIIILTYQYLRPLLVIFRNMWLIWRVTDNCQ